MRFLWHGLVKPGVNRAEMPWNVSDQHSNASIATRCHASCLRFGLERAKPALKQRPCVTTLLRSCRLPEKFAAARDLAGRGTGAFPADILPEGWSMELRLLASAPARSRMARPYGARDRAERFRQPRGDDLCRAASSSVSCTLALFIRSQRRLVAVIALRARAGACCHAPPKHLRPLSIRLVCPH